MTVQEIYEQTIQPLPASDRLHLATLILNGIPPRAVVDYGDDWSEEDIREATRFSLERATASFGEDEADS